MRSGRYPRVTAITVAGTLLVAVAGILWVADVFGLLEVGRMPVRIGIVGAVVALFGLAGYLSMWVFDTRHG